MNLHTSLSAPYVLVTNTEACHRLPLADITHLSAHNSSTVIHTTGKRKVVAACPIAHYEKALLSFGFFRIHQSTLINLHHLRAIVKQEGTHYAHLSTGENLSIARAKKNDLMHHLRAQSIHHPSPYNPQNIPHNNQ